MKKICVFTATRAEYGILSGLMSRIKEDGELKLQTLVTGAHLSDAYGRTISEIESDGFNIDAKADILRFDDTRQGTAKAAGLGIQLFADILQRLEPDMAVILGDRYEMLAAASACFFMNVPIAHLYGGEITEGAFDDSIRHAITKLSRLHFTSTESYRRRIIQMGEQPGTVVNCGSLALDRAKTVDLISEQDVRDICKADRNDKIMLVTYHPETNDCVDVKLRFKYILDSIDNICKHAEIKIIFTGANADPGGTMINKMAEEYAEKHCDRAVFINSLGQRRFMSVLRYASCVVGNSSSGIIEAPSFGAYTLNIGDRQKGRTAADSVINAGYDDALSGILSELLKKERHSFNNPYEKEGTAEIIINTLRTDPDFRKIPKKFYDLP